MASKDWCCLAWLWMDENFGGMGRPNPLNWGNGLMAMHCTARSSWRTQVPSWSPHCSSSTSGGKELWQKRTTPWARSESFHGRAPRRVEWVRGRWWRQGHQRRTSSRLLWPIRRHRKLRRAALTGIYLLLFFGDATSNRWLVNYWCIIGPCECPCHHPTPC